MVFCISFFGLIVFANSLQDEPVEETRSEFSQHRIDADKASKKRDLDMSLQNLRAMVKKDPFDGRAQYRLSSTLYSQIVSAQKARQAVAAANSINTPNSNSKLLAPQQSDQPNRPLAPPLTPKTEPNADNAIADDQVRALIDQAIQEYQLAIKHVRYRRRSQFQLAMLWTAKGDYKTALDNLEDFVVGGGTTKDGIGQIKHFGTRLSAEPTRLHAHPRFASLEVLEKENQSKQNGHRNFEANVRPQYRSARGNLLPVVLQEDLPSSQGLSNNSFWGFLKRLNNDLIPYRIKLIDFIRELFK